MSGPEYEKENRLDNILKKAEIYTHFIENGKKSKSKTSTLKKSAKSSQQPHRTNRQEDKEEVGDEKQTIPATARFEQSPFYINGEMRDYQLRGLNWLISLYDNGINGILADEMGLGKTLQTISIIGFLKHFEKNEGPHLVICPKSTLSNWFNEFNRFCPSVKAVTLKGDETARSETIAKMSKIEWNVCITTYQICLRAQSQLRHFSWQYLVVDEAQRLKNENSKLSQALRKFRSKYRLLLTGTPLQNNLHELWALLNFLLPRVFSSADDFDSWFDSDDCLRGNDTTVKRLQTILRPFMLRRIKSEVEKSLLPKKEVKLFVGLTPLQRDVYIKVLKKDVTVLSPLGGTSQKDIRMILMELRKAANHPYLIDNIEPGPPYTTDEHLINSCGKMMVLDKLLAKLKAQGSKVLLFSEFVIMLNILEDYLVFRGYKYRRLDGTTDYDDRAKDIDEFNDENNDIFVYLISTRAGGLGINLASADAVVIYDSDWNPQVDLQAIDRAHRIGQKKQVRVFRLVTENTVDERIVQRAEIKLRLDKLVIQAGRSTDANAHQPTKESDRDVIRFGLDKIMDPKASDCIDVDIDKLLKEGETKTAKEQAKYDKLGENQLRNLTLEEASATSVYQFEGCDFRSMNSTQNGSDGNLCSSRRDRTAANDGKKKYEQLVHKFQFYPAELYNICRPNGVGQLYLDLTDNNEYKKSLLSCGFSNWSLDNVQQFCDAMAKYGRNNLEMIAKALPDKKFDQVSRYHKAFWKRARKDLDRMQFFSLIEKLTEKERKIRSLNMKMASCSSPEGKLILNEQLVPENHYEHYTLEHDRYLIGAMHRIGLNTPDCYRKVFEDVCSSGLFAGHAFVFRNATEVERRCEAILEILVKEQQYSVDTKSSINDNDANSISLYKFQFFPQELYDMCKKNPGQTYLRLCTSDNTEHKLSLLNRGFRHWSRDHVQVFCDTMAKYGRNNLEQIAEALPRKTLDEITEYQKVFWERGEKEIGIQMFDNLTKKLRLKERRIDALNWKMSLYESPQTELKLDNKFIPGNYNEYFSVKHDRYLICAMHEIGLNTKNPFSQIMKNHRSDKLFRTNSVFQNAGQMAPRGLSLLDILVKEHMNSKRKNYEDDQMSNESSNECAPPKKKRKVSSSGSSLEVLPESPSYQEYAQRFGLKQVIIKLRRIDTEM